MRSRYEPAETFCFATSRSYPRHVTSHLQYQGLIHAGEPSRGFRKQNPLIFTLCDRPCGTGMSVGKLPKTHCAFLAVFSGAVHLGPPHFFAFVVLGWPIVTGPAWQRPGYYCGRERQ